MNQIDKALESILMPEQRAQYRQQLETRKEREAAHIELLRCEVGRAMTLLGDVIVYPRVARADIETVIKHLNKALSAAAVLDPE